MINAGAGVTMASYVWKVENSSDADALPASHSIGLTSATLTIPKDTFTAATTGYTVTCTATLSDSEVVETEVDAAWIACANTGNPGTGSDDDDDDDDSSNVLAISLVLALVALLF